MTTVNIYKSTQVMSSWSDDPDTITVVRQPTTYRDAPPPKSQARNLDRDKSHNTMISTATHLRHSHAENNPSTQNQQMRNRQDLNTSSPSTYSVTANVISLAHEENGERILHENTTATFANLSLTTTGSNSHPIQNSQLPVCDKIDIKAWRGERQQTRIIRGSRGCDKNRRRNRVPSLCDRAIAEPDLQRQAPR